MHWSHSQQKTNIFYKNLIPATPFFRFINPQSPLHLFYCAIACLLFLVQCKSSKSVVLEKTLKFQYSEAYCGGSAPSEAMLLQMSAMKPMANRDIEIFEGNPMYITPSKHTTNALGEIKVPNSPGKIIYINIYPSVDGFKNDPEEFECYKKFMIQNLIPVDLSVPDLILNFSTHLHCNPCIPPAP